MDDVTQIAVYKIYVPISINVYIAPSKMHRLTMIILYATVA